MPCYRPWLGLPQDENENGKRPLSLVAPWNPDNSSLFPDAVRVPCGKCIGCRLDQSRQWADRMMLELDNTGKGIFLTLTYNNDHVPEPEDYEGRGIYTLQKSDLQKFFKRLRKRYSDREIRFYACGEYGSTTYRPHYHAIVFGLSLDDFPEENKFFVGKNDLGDPYYNVKEIQDTWSIKGDQIGFVCVSEVSWKTCAYVARYVQKKVLGSHELFYEAYGLEKEFSLMSRRPGIGAYYLKKHPDLFDLSNLYTKGNPNPISIPKYFLQKLSLTDPVKYDKLCNERKQFASDASLLKMQQTELEFCEQCVLEERLHSSKAKNLKRL